MNGPPLLPKTDFPIIHTGLSSLISNSPFRDIYIYNRMVFSLLRVVSIIVIEEMNGLVITRQVFADVFFSFYKFDRL